MKKAVFVGVSLALLAAAALAAVQEQPQAATEDCKRALASNMEYVNVFLKK